MRKQLAHSVPSLNEESNMVMMTPDNNDHPPDPAKLSALADAIHAHGQATEANQPPIPPALTPAKVEALMARVFTDPEVRDMAAYVRAAEAKPGLPDPDAGQPDLGPLCMVTHEATQKGGPEAQGITFMFAAYGLWCYWRDKGAGGKGEVAS